MREQEIQFAIEDARYEKKEKRTKKAELSESWAYQSWNVDW